MSAVIENAVRDSTQPGKQVRATPDEPPAPEVKAGARKMQPARLAAIIAICCLFLVLGYFLALRNIDSRIDLFAEKNPQTTYKVADQDRTEISDSTQAAEEKQKSGIETETGGESALGTPTDVPGAGEEADSDKGQSTIVTEGGGDSIENGAQKLIGETDITGESASRASSTQPVTPEVGTRISADGRQSGFKRVVTGSVREPQAEPTESTPPESRAQISTDASRSDTRSEHATATSGPKQDNALGQSTLASPILTQTDDQSASAIRVSTEEGGAPQLLGQLTVRAADTLGSMIKMVYGIFTVPYLNIVERANPNLADPDTIQVGDTIYFPSIPITVNSSRNQSWWIRIITYHNLIVSIDTLRSYPQHMPPIRLVPHWHEMLGLRFDIISNEVFRSKAEAEAAITEFGTFFAPQTLLPFNRWESGTVFMADPFKSVQE